MRIFSLSRLGGRLVAFALIGCFALLVHFSRASSATPTDGATPHGQRGPLSGPARIIDGDTVAIGAVHIRLEGIDAPESSQMCGEAAGQPWACGHEATRLLVALVGNRPITCEPSGLDKHGRTLATCFVDGRNLNAELVRRGLAWAFVRYSQRYVGEEAAARADKAGVWRQAGNLPPWEYRTAHWQQAEARAPQGCAIKGNVGRHGAIYHTPWSPWYGKVHMDGGAGKRWFCSEGEALAAGFRPASAP